MRKALLLRLVFTLVFSPLVGMIVGCGEDSGAGSAIILETNPDDGGWMFAEESLIIRFDRPVALVKVNGVVADVDDTHAYWQGSGLEAGKHDLTIEWTDENGGANSENMTLSIQKLDLTVCSGSVERADPDCDVP